MSNHTSYKDFNAATVPLEGSNLIEASAGTGKTYSIAILVLRLILEKQFSVKEILMVTFTRAAVAELEERVRLFIRTAHKYAGGTAISDENIQALVDQAVGASSPEEVMAQLKEAVLFLDETAVLTIHSFCQLALNEFAFETNQLFGAEMLPDLGLVIEEELNKFWRRNITTLPAALLQYVYNEGMKANLLEVLKNHASGKRYPGYQPRTRYSITKTLQDKWLKEVGAIEAILHSQNNGLIGYVAANATRLKDACAGDRYAKAFVPFIDTPASFIQRVTEKKDTKYVAKLLPDILTRLQEIESTKEQLQEAVYGIRQHLFYAAIQEAGKGISQYKERNNLLGYDDLISNLHEALVLRNNPRLADALQKKYKAVFIDEFQDTDRQQFELFDKAFGQSTILFYIGDPKQSIYAWRKADIFTYFRAREAVQHLYSMNRNFRSGEQMIEAMNAFFLPAPGFDTFYFKGAGNSIDYIPVNSPLPNTKGQLLQDGQPAIPMPVYALPNKAALNEAVAAQVAQLLVNEAYQIEKKGVKRRIQPSDIGILVRTRMQGSEVKIALGRLGIPAVTIDDARILQSTEARYLLYIMEAIANPNRSTINRALLSPFTGLGTDQLLLLDDAVVLEYFTRYKTRWQDDGVYTALIDFTNDFNVQQVLLQSATINGERIITNLYQLIELVHQAESRKNLSVTELISWLQRGLDGMSADGDEYLQRMESDEEAVKIVTIHKSKGLEYNIVLAPFLDFTENSKQELLSFRDPDSGDYIGAEKTRMSEEQLLWQQEQAEQENRRLLYVAITRAVYQCYLFRNSYYKTSTLVTFLEALTGADPSLIAFMKDAPAVPAHRYRTTSTTVTPTPKPVHFQLAEEYWRKMSYTMLAAKAEYQLPPRVVKELSDYDTFIFYTLRRGAKTGNFLHYIFENIRYSEESNWEKVLQEAIRRYVPGQEETYMPLLKELLGHVLQINIGPAEAPFTLADITWYKKLTELEFDFPVPLFSPEKLQALSDDEVSIMVRSLHQLPGHELEGMMNGKIDLFFEHEGQYYILDWKSNYLGSDLEDYSPAALARAMNEHNYHLQYLIYTVAAKKYLESRLPSFDYGTQFGGVVYLFVRGIRAGKDYGIFRHKPSAEKIAALERLLTNNNRLSISNTDTGHP